MTYILLMVQVAVTVVRPKGLKYNCVRPDTSCKITHGIAVAREVQEV